jgi:peroxiredoxin Q/BCP
MRLTRIALVAMTLAACALLLLRPRVARAEILKEGQMAPDFSGQMVVGDEVKPVRLIDFTGKKLILYFYPKDQTPGCTKEACAFRDSFALYDKAGVALLGCSVDSADAHKAFIKKYSLPFPLLLDPDKKIANAYGAANGIPILGLNRRITYVIDEKGKIIKAFPEVDPAVHAGEVLALINSLKPSPTPSPSPSARPSPSPAADIPKEEEE